MHERLLLVLWLTGRCNLSCSYCYASAGPEGQDMTFDTAIAALERFRDRPLKIQFAGGEPMLNFPLAEAVCAYAEENRMDAVFRMQTNGTLITEDLATRLRRAGIRVGVSLDGIPQVNSRTRGRTAQAVSGIRALGSQGLQVGLNAVVTAETADQLPALVDFGFYLGNVGGIGLDLLRHAGRGSRQADPEPEVLRQALIRMEARSRALGQSFGRTVQIREVELARKRLRGLGDPHACCYAACGRSVVVLPDGSTYPCGSLLTSEYAMGPIGDLTGSGIRSLKPERPADCVRCRYGRICPGGCPSRTLRNHNDLECVLLKTAFSIAEKEEMEDPDRQGRSTLCV